MRGTHRQLGICAGIIDCDAKCISDNGARSEINPHRCINIGHVAVTAFG